MIFLATNVAPSLTRFTSVAEPKYILLTNSYRSSPSQSASRPCKFENTFQIRFNKYLWSYQICYPIWRRENLLKRNSMSWASKSRPSTFNSTSEDVINIRHMISLQGFGVETTCAAIPGYAIGEVPLLPRKQWLQGLLHYKQENGDHTWIDA